MRKIKRIISITAVIASALMAIQSANARTWEFEKANILDGGWKYDTTNPQPFPGGIGNVTFSQSQNLLKRRNDGNQRIGGRRDKILQLTSGDRFLASNRGGANMQGSGIERANTFNRKMEARCRMVGNNEQVRRSQASFWQDVSGPNTLEIDVFEMKPGGNFLNFLTWLNGNRVKLNDPRNISTSERFDTIQDAKKWANFACTTNNSRSNYTCTRKRGGNTFRRTFTKLSNISSGKTVILHNKPWRIAQDNLSFGPTATLECDYVKN